MMACVCTPTHPVRSDRIEIDVNGGWDVIMRVGFVSPSSREVYGVVTDLVL
jgi:hypothetical protein